MSQPIDVGAVLGGRYKVTEVVLASADGDVVLDGTDQVLNRTVSILVASSANASQVATSAREIATGERYGAMQVLDLGISEGSTYLITNTAEPADLLDLVIQRDTPFVEPFYTDTLGSEIFGVSRSTEPHVYDDDEEYYEEQRAQEANRPGVMDRLPEINLSERFSGLKARFNRGRETDGDGTGDPGPVSAADSTDADSLDATEAAAGGAVAASAAPAAALPPRPAAPPSQQPSPSQQPAGEDTGEIQRPPATQAQSLPPVKPATPKASDTGEERGAARPAHGRTSNKVSLYDDAEPQGGQ
ncbi:MAG: ABC transporter substrate-binding protein, partial [Arthrobacter sp.]